MDVAILENKSLSNLALALSKAQGEFPVIPKNSKVEVKSKEGKFLYSYMYADLTEIINCTRTALKNNNLSFTHTYDRIELGFYTLIIHSTGETLRTGFIPCKLPDNSDMKQVAATVTYAKRISLTAALGISADEDLDAGQSEAQQGNSTEKVAPQKKQQPQTAPQQKPAEKKPPKLISEEQLKRLHAIGNQHLWSHDDIKAYIFEKRGLTSTKDLNREQYDWLCGYIEKNPKSGVPEGSKPMSKLPKDYIIEGMDFLSNLNGKALGDIPLEELQHLQGWINSQKIKDPAPTGMLRILEIESKLKKFLGESP